MDRYPLEVVDVGADRRVGAARALAELPGDNVTEALIGRLADPTVSVRLAAVQSLAGRPDAPDEMLVEALLGCEPEIPVEAEAAALIERADSDGAAAARMAEAYTQAMVSADRLLTDDWLRDIYDHLDGEERRRLAAQAAGTALEDPVGALRARRAALDRRARGARA